MKVILAETAGFCMGVSLALKKLDRAVRKGGATICTLGPIIHNPQVLEHYEKLGVKRIQSPAEVEPDTVVVIRAHGIPQDVELELKKHGVVVVDATCPKVKKAQLLIERQAERGRTLLLYGEENHPEVKGLLSYAKDDAEVFDSLEELQGHINENQEYFLAAQTTQDRGVFEQIRDYAKQQSNLKLPVLETICDATKVRQHEAVEVAKRVDKMVVVGGYQSGNTRRLAQVVREQGVDCIHVETAEELNPEDFADCSLVGLTAGASTHDITIDEVRAALEGMSSRADH
ncbi:4-hydroxy-3-methylbut-2-enyl diphosphate reductase [Desulfovibrio ferrophilus]|uniref:4-hydroxy-3-methylbut-2-enyl diphosphate reductase n=1 Tax=Desulfovibrio ferrophilus TaxID=241368 RepID=A0A2Z6AXJ3_9BACT|nr:4-hydroxy-3-methylbut-2-enyl diphosphate reductase [Desulfovibrio ferrophilus]BBD07982.1 4-hydroxy-3-methylbut-2-enyl diphosphate reductase [Desulfovibrio ferrophilus]